MVDEYVTTAKKKFKVVDGTLKINRRDIKDITKIQNLDNLQSIKRLWLNENSISEIKGLDKLVNLQELYLRLNKIKVIKGLESLVNLQVLDLRANQIKEIGGLETLTKLQTLRLSVNQIEEIKGLENLPNLRALFLGENKIKNLSNLKSQKNLKEIWLNKNQITEIKGLEGLENLEELYLRENKIKEIKGINTLRKLKNLYLDRNDITTIKGLEKLKNLQKLGLSGNPIIEHEKIYMNKKIPDILNYCLIKAKKREEKRRKLDEQQKYEKYHTILLDSILSQEQTTLESLSNQEVFQDVDIKEILIKTLINFEDLAKYVSQNMTPVSYFLQNYYQKKIPDYRLVSKLKLYIRILLNEFSEKVIINNVLFEEDIEEIFRFNRDEIIYLTNKRGIVIGKKFISPPRLNIPGLITAEQIGKQPIQAEKIPVQYIDIFPISKIVTIYVEEIPRKSSSSNEIPKARLKPDIVKSSITHKLTIAFKEYNREFKVEEQYLRNIWRICKYMVE